jgi:uncharacterized protein (TIGR00251 family)
VRAVAGGVRIDLKVIPRSPKNIVGGIRNNRLIVRVTAAPVDNAANEAVIELLADALEVPERSVRLASGSTARQKTVEVLGIDPAAARSRLF